MKDTLLIVDDDVVIRQLLTMVFASKYTVLTAEDGTQAMELFNDNAERIAAVITDARMPRMTGMELISRLGDRGIPAVPTVLMSGNLEDEEIEGMLAKRRDIIFEAKPFSIGSIKATLQRAMKRCLAQTPPGACLQPVQHSQRGDGPADEIGLTFRENANRVNQSIQWLFR